VTCIVGLVEGGVVYIGGDSAGVSGYDLTVRAEELRSWQSSGNCRL
jgi:hypothetical protein